MVLPQKELVDELKVEWKNLWSERVDDKIRAEGVAKKDYTALFIDQGTVIHATRDFKALNFKDILEQHKVSNAERYIAPNPTVGGWGKFVKDNITNQQSKTEKNTAFSSKGKNEKHLKKSGRGWLHQ